MKCVWKIIEKCTAYNFLCILQVLFNRRSEDRALTGQLIGLPKNANEPVRKGHVKTSIIYFFVKYPGDRFLMAALV